MKMKLEIVRTFYQSHSSKVEIYENGELNNQIVSVNDANKRVFELIGISLAKFVNFGFSNFVLLNFDNFVLG